MRNKALLKEKYPEIFEELDLNLNKQYFPDLDLNTVSVCSSFKLWWICPKCGKKYRMPVYSRTCRKSSCPDCNGNKRFVKEHNLKSNIFLYSELDLEKNKEEYGDLLYEDITLGSQIKLWWKCNKCGRSWKASVKDRSGYNSGCPHCYKENNAKIQLITRCKKAQQEHTTLREKFPEVYKYLDLAKTKKEYPYLDVENVPAYSRLKVYWINSDKLIKIESRVTSYVAKTKRQNTPKTPIKRKVPSSSLLKNKFPDIFSEIDIEKTKEYFPDVNIEELSYSSHQKVYWKNQNSAGKHIYRINDVTQRKSIISKMSNRVYSEEYNIKKLCPEIYESLVPELNSKIYENAQYDKISIFCVNKLWFNYNGENKYMSVRERVDCLTRTIDINNYKKYLGLIKAFEEHSVKTNHLLKNTKLWNFVNIEETKKRCPYLDINKLGYDTFFKIYWTCDKGHVFMSPIKGRLSNGCPECANRHSIPETTFYDLCKEYVDDMSELGTYINGWEIDVYLPKLKYCFEYDGERWHNSNEVKSREKRKNSAILSDKSLKMIRIKETSDIDKIQKFKEIDNGVTVYYICGHHMGHVVDGFIKIFKDIFDKDINREEIIKFYKKNKVKYLNNKK